MMRIDYIRRVSGKDNEMKSDQGISLSHSLKEMDKVKI